MSVGEQWRPVVGYEGLYEVSDMGRIKSLHGKPRLLQPWKDNRYLRVSLHRNSSRENIRVHRLVLEAFVGPCPSGMEALHGRGGGYDNRLANLRWGTRKENCQDIVEHGKHHLASKTHCLRGHPLSGGNLGTDSRNPRHRFCRECQRAAKRRYYRRKREVMANV